MNSFFAPVIALLLTIPLMAPQPAYGDRSAVFIQSVAGTIIADGIEAVEILPAKDKSKTLILRVSEESYIADAVSGKPASLSERKDDKVVAYFITAGPGEYRAVALVLNIPEDYSPPVYAKAMQVNRGDGQLYVLTDRRVIVTINEETPIELFFTRDTATIDNITGNTDLLLWNQAYSMSIPARTAANKVIILGNAAG